MTAIVQPGGSMRDAEVLRAVERGGRGDAGDRDPPLPPLTRDRPLTARPRRATIGPHDRSSPAPPSGSRRPTCPVEDLLRVAHGAPVELAPDAVERIRASRAIVDRLVDGPALIYGLNTGLGHMRDERVPRETLRQYQELIVAAHEGAIGEPLPTPVVRAAMAVRLNGIARGGAGASLPVAEALAALLNAGVTPVVARTGSVGRVGPHAHGRDRPGADRARATPRSRARSCRAPRPSRGPASRPSSSSPRTASR